MLIDIPSKPVCNIGSNFYIDKRKWIIKIHTQPNWKATPIHLTIHVLLVSIRFDWHAIFLSFQGPKSKCYHSFGGRRLQPHVIPAKAVSTPVPVFIQCFYSKT